jgi:hypothetical protein
MNRWISGGRQRRKSRFMGIFSWVWTQRVGRDIFRVIVFPFRGNGDVVFSAWSRCRS